MTILLTTKFPTVSSSQIILPKAHHFSAWLSLTTPKWGTITECRSTFDWSPTYVSPWYHSEEKSTTPNHGLESWCIQIEVSEHILLTFQPRQFAARGFCYSYTWKNCLLQNFSTAYDQRTKKKIVPRRNMIEDEQKRFRLSLRFDLALTARFNYTFNLTLWGNSGGCFEKRLWEMLQILS